MLDRPKPTVGCSADGRRRYGIVLLLVLIEFVNQCTVQGMDNVKLVNAKQAIIIHRSKNTKENSLESDAQVWFNKKCRFAKKNLIVVKLYFCCMF